jgi:hypothetical protein
MPDPTPSIEWEAKLEPHHSGFDDPTIVAHAFRYGDGFFRSPTKRNALAECGWPDRTGMIVNDDPSMPVPHCVDCERVHAAQRSER